MRRSNIETLIIEKDCAKCTGKDLNCNHIYMCDTDRICIFQKMYDDIFDF